MILDYGAQYTQLIARAAREQGAYGVIVPYYRNVSEINALKPRDIILSGGPNSVYDRDAPGLDPSTLNLNVPVLGICYGIPVMAQALAVRSRRHNRGNTTRLH